MRKEGKLTENKTNQKNDKIRKTTFMCYFELIFQNLIYYFFKSVNNYKSKTIILIIIIFLD